jgi:hypothetical protein
MLFFISTRRDPSFAFSAEKMIIYSCCGDLADVLDTVVVLAPSENCIGFLICIYFHYETGFKQQYY